MRDAYDLPMAEFLERLKWAEELAGEARGEGLDPMSRHMKLMHRQMQKWANRNS